MAVHCVWCGKEIEEIEGQATMDTCEECEDFFEEHIKDISNTLNELLKENETDNSNNNEKKDKKIDNKKKSWISYSLITAIHMLSSKPYLEFKDSKYKEYLPSK